MLRYCFLLFMIHDKRSKSSLSLILYVVLIGLLFRPGFSEDEIGSSGKTVCEQPTENNNNLNIYDREKGEFVRASDSYSNTKNLIKNFREENGRPITREDYDNIILCEKNNLSHQERDLLWLSFCRAQRSSITKEDLTKIYLSKRDSVKDVFAEFNVERFQSSSDVNNQKIEFKKMKYAVKNNSNFYYEVESEDSDGNVYHRLSTLNNSDFRFVVFTDSTADAGIQEKVGSEFASDGLCINMPLVQSMIFDLTIYHLNRDAYDMPMMLSRGGASPVIMETTEMFEGNECLVIADQDRVFYLDVNKDYSFCGAEFFEETDLSTKGIRSTHPRSRRILRELVSYGNGIWLPSEVETIYYDADQNITSSEKITYNEIRINKGIKDSFFEDVIPDGAHVADSIRDMVYIWGDHPSLGSLIKETVKIKRQTIFRNLSLILGLCFIACWGIIEWRRRRLLKGEVE